MQETDAVINARREMEICNACRYCEGFCAVFPAMELRREFSAGDLSYLANLCHNCRGCYYACQYSPPHEWGINVPTTLAEVRAESYAEYAWPKPLAVDVQPQRHRGLADRRAGHRRGADPEHAAEHAGQLLRRPWHRAADRSTRSFRSGRCRSSASRPSASRWWRWRWGRGTSGATPGRATSVGPIAARHRAVGRADAEEPRRRR